MGFLNALIQGQGPRLDERTVRVRRLNQRAVPSATALLFAGRKVCVEQVFLTATQQSVAPTQLSELSLKLIVNFLKVFPEVQPEIPWALFCFDRSPARHCLASGYGVSSRALTLYLKQRTL